MFRIFILFIIIFLGNGGLGAQTGSPGPSILAKYRDLIPVFPEIHNGGLYTEPHVAVAGHPFLDSGGFKNGNLHISGFDFKDVPLQYDVWNDILVTINPFHNQRVTLNPLKIDRFTLADGSKFVKKKQQFINDKNGFYREIIKDEISFYCKHWKEIKKRGSVFTILNAYQEKKQFFIEIDGKLMGIHKRKQAFHLLGLSKKEIRPVVNRDKIRFKKEPEQYLTLMVRIANEKNHE